MVWFTGVSIRTTVSHGVRDRPARRSARRYDFVSQYIRAYAVVQREECRHDGMQQCQYTKSTVHVRDRDRDRTSRRSARRCEFVSRNTGAYAVVQHEECSHDGVQQYQYTKGTAPVRDRDRTARKSACRSELYHNILGRTRSSYSTKSAGTTECSSTSTLRVLFPYAIVQHYREYANAEHE